VTNYKPFIQKKTTYRTIEGHGVSEFKDRGSKFIAFASEVSTIDDVKNKLKHLKEEHPKAVHFCYGFRIGTDGNVFRAADDGEPSGSAGKPILGQIDSAGLTDILIVVVRYFGGTLLGVPGLINAYKTAAYEALQLAVVVEKNMEARYALEFPYTLMNDVMRIVKQHQVRIVTSEMTLFCEYEIRIPLTEVTDAIDKFEKLREVAITSLP
jgi:uncharacterized YigZ family protein